MGGLWNWVRRAKELYGWYRFIAAVVFALIAGIGLAVGGGVWLVLHSGIPIPLIMMAAFCTIVGTVYLAMAPLAYRALAQQVSAEQAPVTRSAKSPINYTAIRLQHQYLLAPVSRLWVGLPPSASAATHESTAWYDTLVSAIQQGKLKFIPKKPGLANYEQQNPDYNTKLSRVELKRYAASIGQDPEFLRDG